MQSSPDAMAARAPRPRPGHERGPDVGAALRHHGGGQAAGGRAPRRVPSHRGGGAVGPPRTECRRWPSASRAGRLGVGATPRHHGGGQAVGGRAPRSAPQHRDGGAVGPPRARCRRWPSARRAGRLGVGAAPRHHGGGQAVGGRSPRPAPPHRDGGAVGPPRTARLRADRAVQAVQDAPHPHVPACRGHPPAAGLRQRGDRSWGRTHAGGWGDGVEPGPRRRGGRDVRPARTHEVFRPVGRALARGLEPPARRPVARSSARRGRRAHHGPAGDPRRPMRRARRARGRRPAAACPGARDRALAWGGRRRAVAGTPHPATTAWVVAAACGAPARRPPPRSPPRPRRRGAGRAGP